MICKHEYPLEHFKNKLICPECKQVVDEIVMEPRRNRPKTTQIVIDEFTKLLDSQDDKGLMKYGTSIDSAELDENGEPYDWPLMAMEELADFSKYQVKEIKRLENRVKRLQSELEKTMHTIFENCNLRKQIVFYEELFSQQETIIQKLKQKDALKHDCRANIRIIWGKGTNTIAKVICNECGDVLNVYEGEEREGGL